MIEVELPDTEGVPELVRSFAACLASVTETPLTDVPQPGADLRGAIAHWRSWLAGRGAGLVPIAQPARFNWPGYWLAVLGDPAPTGATEDGTAVLMFGTPSGVVLSPQQPACRCVLAMSCPHSTPPSPRPARRCPSCVARSRRSRWLHRRLVQCVRSLRCARWPGEGWTEIVTPLRRGPSPRTTTLPAATTSRSSKPRFSTT